MNETEIINTFGPWGVVVIVLFWFMKMITKLMESIDRNNRTLEKAMGLFEVAKDEFVKVNSARILRFGDPNGDKKS